MSNPGEPARQRFRLEPDIPLEFSNLLAVKEMIAENNRQVKPKQRLKPFEFINDVFTKLGDRAVSDESVAGLLLDFLQECVEKHDTFPRSSTLAKVLYLWSEKGLVEAAQKLLRQLLGAELLLQRNVIDEKVATVSLRLLTRTASADLDLAKKVLGMLPEGSHKRRLFFPMLEHAARLRDTELAFDMLRLGQTKGVEFWDVDFKQLICCLENAIADSDVIASLADELLECMLDHHPVVGRSNGEALQRLLGGDMARVNDATGECSRCGSTLHTFDFDLNDRTTLLNDIETKLIVPRLEGASRYEPERTVMPAEKDRRWREYEAFKAKISDCGYDAVIDGANVGYYGLSSWYREAKEALLRTRGVDPALVPEHELSGVPMPVDVSPKFPLIDAMLTETRRLGRKPLIMLHNRHVETHSIENDPWILKWKAESALVPCPGFINDDYCWLYAAIRKPNCLIISNDQMRDHHFMLLSRRSFLRWRQRHRVTYRALFEQATGFVSLIATLPRPYAVWVQRGKLSRSHWHVPVLSTVDVIDQATNRVSEKERTVEKDGDDLCDMWLCSAPQGVLTRSE